ncbi:MAG TPA: BadF/BadG/BcrA/BcrD ATPase family protein [Bacteroidota bacterium]|nr:BadF/BadG/BcrA/BcrD ATPase family protein [Bacteroidota bacterium]
MGEQQRCVIGIDGGGTKTHAILVGLDGGVLAEAFGGPTNLQTVPIKTASSTIFDLITETCTKAQCTADDLQNVVLGLAGAGRPADRSELSSALLGLSLKKKFPLKNVTIETDARVALEAAFAGGPGIVLIAGTGSIALYRSEDGKLLRAGGWGYILGDEGSGYSIARDALNFVMRQSDGRSEKTLLTAKALEFFGVSQPDEILAKVYHEHIDLASFAQKVFEAVVERDRVAHMVIVKNSTELIELVRVLTMKLRPRKKLPVALMGGLLESDNVYSKMVRERIIHSLPNVVVQNPKFSAAFGATIIGLNAFR